MTRPPSCSHPALVAALCLVGLGLAACRPSPRQVVERAVAAAADGDRAGYEATLTRASAALVGALVTVEGGLQREASAFLPRPGLPGVRVVDERIGPDRARVTLEAGQRRLELVLQPEDGEWRIDLLETQVRLPMLPTPGELLDLDGRP